jgi:seryl-tRNA synthetase
MLQIQTIRENPEFVIERLQIKNINAKDTIANILNLDAEIRALKKTLDHNLMEQNKVSKDIGILFKTGKANEADILKEKIADLKVSEKDNQLLLSEKEQAILDLLILLPNLPHSSVPSGVGADDNEIIHQEGDASNMHETALPHWDLVKKYDIIDFELGTKITGAGFPNL